MRYSIGVLREQLIQLSDDAGLEYEIARTHYEQTLKDLGYPVFYYTLSNDKIELLRAISDFLRYDGDNLKVAIVRALKKSNDAKNRVLGNELEKVTELDLILANPFFKDKEFLGFCFGVKMLSLTGGNLSAFIDFLVAQSV